MLETWVVWKELRSHPFVSVIGYHVGNRLKLEPFSEGQMALS